MTHLQDTEGNRIVICNYCKKKKKTDDCVIYGGKNQENNGICRECAKKKGLIK